MPMSSSLSAQYLSNPSIVNSLRKGSFSFLVVKVYFVCMLGGVLWFVWIWISGMRAV